MSLPLFQKRRSSVSASTLVNFLTLNFLPPCFLFKFLCQLHANIFIAFYIFCVLCEEHSYSLGFLRSGFPNVLINILTPTGHTHTQTAPLLLNVNDGQWTTFAVESWKKSYMLYLSQSDLCHSNSYDYCSLFFHCLLLQRVLSSLCVLSSVNSLTEESCKINFHRLVVQQKKERKSCRRWSKLCVCHFLLIKTYSRCPLNFFFSLSP